MERYELSTSDNHREVLAAFAAIEQFNKDASVGTLLGEAISARLSGEEIDQDAIYSRVVASFEILRSQYEGILNDLGLGLEFTDQKGGEIFLSLDEKNYRGAKLGLNIKDGEKLINTLKQVESSAVCSDDLEMIELIAGAISEQIKNEYNFEDAEDDRIHTLFTYLGNIVAEVKRVTSEGDKSSMPSSEKLMGYYEASQRGYLREYLEAEKNALLRLPWGSESILRQASKHGDYALEEPFSRVIRVLHDIYKNEKARTFHGDLVRRAAEFAANLETDINAWLGASDMPSGTTADLSEEQLKYLDQDDNWRKFSHKEHYLELVGKFRQNLNEFEP
ncbi:MAG: hypothetical protein KBB55_02760 [Candidatus Buchananbacteria bacterium]|nr:hypothetical protein [Candidatus Buchananbacteria bacterium]